jgi:hypothetical protein
MPTLKPDTIFPTAEEDAKITAEIASDFEDFELDEEWFRRAKPASELFSKEFFHALLSLKEAKIQPESEQQPMEQPHPLG